MSKRLLDSIAALDDVVRMCQQTTDEAMIIAAIRKVQDNLRMLPAYGLTNEQLQIFAEKIVTKIRGLDVSAGEAALKFVDTGGEQHKDIAKRYQAESAALSEVMVELNRARDASAKS